MARRLARHLPSLAAFALAATVARAQEPDPGLLDMSLEDLTNVEVTTASRRTQDAFATPASVRVLTAEDIRRSGARTVPDMLRLIPGVHVAQVNAHLWAVSVRGFNWTYASRLLVMIDGRTVYTTLTAGVDWDSIGLLPEDIERIELVRGSGGTIWGANAVNGVINILTKPALETRGTDAGLRLGARTPGETFVRHGGRLGRSDYRVGVRLTEAPENDDPGRPRGSDAWRSAHAGFRLDRELREGSLTLAVDATRGTWRAAIAKALTAEPYRSVTAVDAEALDASVLARWTRRRDRGDLSVQVFHDVHDRDDGVFDDVLRTTDAELKASWLSGRHAVDWGVGVRRRRDVAGSGGAVRFMPASSSAVRFSAFVQDDVRLGAGFRAIVGTRVEHFESLGWKVQPQARLAWTSPRSCHAAWAAVTKAIRTPARTERALRWDAAAFDAGGMPGLARVVGDPGVRDEEIVTAEAGYRFRTRKLSLDLAAFRARHDGIIDAIEMEPFVETAAGAPPVLVFPSVMTNAHDARSRGAEIAVRWEPRPWLTLDAGASFIRIGSAPKSGVPADAATVFIDGQTPRDQQFLRLHVRLGERAGLDAGWEHVAALPNGAPERHDVSLGIDLRLGAHATLRLQGTRLFRAEHVEFQPAEGSYVTKAGPGADILFNWHF